MAKASTKKGTTVKIRYTASRAIEAARHGAPLFVLNPQRGWIPAGPGALGRAERMLPDALWIYGVR